jgi:hypothetical protein
MSGPWRKKVFVLIIKNDEGAQSIGVLTTVERVFCLAGAASFWWPSEADVLRDR